MIKQCVMVFFIALLSTFFSTVSVGKSQCSGLSSASCASNNTCTWRKASTDKNGKKTKAHCRALPGKSKAKSATKKASTKTKGKITSKGSSSKIVTLAKKPPTTKKSKSTKGSVTANSKPGKKTKKSKPSKKDSR